MRSNTAHIEKVQARRRGFYAFMGAHWLMLGRFSACYDAWGGNRFIHYAKYGRWFNHCWLHIGKLELRWNTK